MADYSQFEASTKSGVHADPGRVREKDEIIRRVAKKRKNSAIYCILCLCLAGIAIIKSMIPAVIFFLIALFFLWRIWGRFSDEYLAEIYEEGLLVPGMIVKTQPLTILAIANMVAQDGADTVNGCYCLVVDELDGAKKELYEKVPCSCFFRYEGGPYHSAFQPHPLYWGTGDRQEVEVALRQVEEDNRENSRDEWEVLREVAERFPALEDEDIILLDENYIPFGKKKYMDSDYQPLPAEIDQDGGKPSRSEEASEEGNGMEEMEIPYLTQDIPGKDAYNKMIEMACRHHVYEYISSHCEYGHVLYAEHPGLFTYIGDSLDFLEEFKQSKISLGEGEYPLIYERCLVTTRGCYHKKKFLPWNEVEFSVKENIIHGLEWYLNGSKVAEFEAHFEGDPKAMSDQQKKMAAQKEAGRLLAFLQELKDGCIDE